MSTFTGSTAVERGQARAIGAEGSDVAPRHRLATFLVRRLLEKRPIILCYHSVGHSDPCDDPEFLRVSPERFVAQLDLLAGAGARFTTVAEIAHRLQDGSASGLVAISFDDGYQDNHDVVLPILEQRNITATVFVTMGLIGQPSPWLNERSSVRMMTPSELRRMADAGIELGAHTLSHPDLTTIDRAQCQAEVEGSKQQLEALIEREVVTFAYPYFHFDDVAREVVLEAGLTGFTGLSRGSFTDPGAVPRVLVTGKDGLTALVLRICGVYELVLYSRLGHLLRRITRGLRNAVRARQHAARAVDG
jgi:peptidoglycan/xylan/chitin deacetylase (PgdA/CDA1 family)